VFDPYNCNQSSHGLLGIFIGTVGRVLTNPGVAEAMRSLTQEAGIDAEFDAAIGICRHGT
jgi:hypothetical protein